MYDQDGWFNSGKFLEETVFLCDVITNGVWVFETSGLIYQSDSGHHSNTKLMLLRSTALDYGYRGCLTAHLDASRENL